LSKSTREEPVFSVAASRKHYGRKKITWLMQVSGEGTVGDLRKVLGHGAPRDAVDSRGRTAVYYAIENNRPENVELLIEKKAAVNVRDEDGWTPLILATHENHLEIVRILLRAGAKLDEKSEDGMTALHIACKWDHPGVVEALLKAGANRTLRSESEQTALQLARTDRVRELFTTKGGRRTRKRSRK
jgi:ankyrin repeat protein